MPVEVALPDPVLPPTVDDALTVDELCLTREDDLWLLLAGEVGILSVAVPVVGTVSTGAPAEL
ncbi:MAG: hypothetical protein ACP5H2_09995 [Solirubrobacteraceae bacterium]